MAEIVGTITNLSDFLSKTQVCLSVKPNDPQQQIICLEADRKYSIPAFQREVRWDDNNLKMLLYDLSRSSKFLGNIILTIKSDHTCEIIDGQQRTTVLMLIVSCIKKKFGTKISTPDLCPLRNEGFTGFQTLLEKAFDQEAITSDDWNAILKSDDYLQLPRIQKLWNTISSSELLADRHKAQGLLDNLCKSEFNIIASYSNDVNTSIQYFLDVNLKGIRLDTEDIFKGYLFSQDSRELTRSLWQKNKRDVGNVKKCAVGKYPKSEKHGNTAQFSEVERSGTQENCGGIGSGCRLRLRPLPVLRRRQSQWVARIDPNAVVVDKNIAENDCFDLFSRQLVRRNLIDFLFLERGEKALHPCVVEAMSGAAEALYHAAARQLGTKG